VRGEPGEAVERQRYVRVEQAGRAQRIQAVGVLGGGGGVEQRLPALRPVLARSAVARRRGATESDLEPVVATLAHRVGDAQDGGVADELRRAHALSP
jgi:hypothetical protein